MKKERIAVQLYTVRDSCATARGLAASLRKVHGIGYRAVQLSGLGPIDPRDIARIVKDSGLACCSTHEDSSDILSRPEAVAEKLSILGCTSTAYPYPSGQDLGSVSGVRRLCRGLNKAGKILRKAGITLAYHNHAIEMHRLGDRTVLDYILSETDPEHLELEIDTHWIQAGGGDPVEWIGRATGRASLLHLKDFGVDAKGNRLFEEIGSGNLPWAGIMSAARRAGCTWYIVEQDGDWEEGDPFLSLKTSFRYLVRSFAQ